MYTRRSILHRDRRQKARKSPCLKKKRPIRFSVVYIVYYTLFQIAKDAFLSGPPLSTLTPRNLDSCSVSSFIWFIILHLMYIYIFFSFILSFSIFFFLNNIALLLYNTRKFHDSHMIGRICHRAFVSCCRAKASINRRNWANLLYCKYLIGPETDYLCSSYIYS